MFFSLLFPLRNAEIIDKYEVKKLFICPSSDMSTLYLPNFTIILGKFNQRHIILFLDQTRNDGEQLILCIANNINIKLRKIKQLSKFCFCVFIILLFFLFLSFVLLSQFVADSNFFGAFYSVLLHLFI